MQEQMLWRAPVNQDFTIFFPQFLMLEVDGKWVYLGSYDPGGNEPVKADPSHSPDRW